MTYTLDNEAGVEDVETLVIGAGPVRPFLGFLRWDPRYLYASLQHRLALVPLHAWTSSHGLSSSSTRYQ